MSTEKLWTGRFKKRLDDKANDFNTSLPFDMRMYRQDIEGSIAHAKMLSQQGVIPPEDGEAIVNGLKGILADIESGKLAFESEYEDIIYIEGISSKDWGGAGDCIPRGAETTRSLWISGCICGTNAEKSKPC
jgi:argininosuccinate lyase